jgi:predicted nucleic acid-binding Zn ribbon protein
MKPPEYCPVCGSAVPARARACPECGADERTGWSESSGTDGLDLPDEEFDYAAYVAREFGGGRPPRRRQRLWWVVALGLLLVFLWVVLFGGR